MPPPSPRGDGCDLARVIGAPAHGVTGASYHPLHDPYLTAPPTATILVLVNAMFKVRVSATPKGRIV
jgi:hypothetical protein